MGNQKRNHHSIKSRKKISLSLKEYYKTHKSVWIGRKMKLKSKRKLSLSLKKYYKTHENPMQGRRHTKEAREKLRILSTGRKLSKKSRLKISKINTGKNHPQYGKKGKDSPNFGQRRTKKQRKRISISHLGNKNGVGAIFSSERRAKISNGNKGKRRTKKQKDKERIRRANNPIPRKDTLIEIKIQNELKQRKITFKKHTPLIGQPDIFIEPNICIFCDGGYVHGDPRKYKSHDLLMGGKLAKDKWKYDKSITRRLKHEKYIVLRFWEQDIHNDIKIIGNKIEKIIKEKK